jgi:hypothetical protein
MQLARARPLHALIASGWIAVAAAGPAPEWTLVRSVEARNGGTIDFVLIPDLKKHDRENYLTVSAAVCGERKQCMVNFWTDPALVPSSPGMTLPQSGAMTAVYERHPTFDKPHLTMACWLYPNKDLAELMNCGYFPGSKARWQR